MKKEQHENNEKSIHSKCFKSIFNVLERQITTSTAATTTKSIHRSWPPNFSSDYLTHSIEMESILTTLDEIKTRTKQTYATNFIDGTTTRIRRYKRKWETKLKSVKVYET